MKKLLIILLAISMIFAFAACAPAEPPVDDVPGADDPANIDDPDINDDTAGDADDPAEDDDPQGNEDDPGSTDTPTQDATPPAQNDDPVKNDTPAQDGNAALAKMELSAIMSTILNGVDNLPASAEISAEIPADAESFAYYAFVDYIEGAKILVSEAMNMSTAHSVVLVRVPDGTDAAAVASQMQTNADPRKWICVEAEKTAVVRDGNTILLVMSATDAVNAITGNFQALALQ